MTHTHDAVAAKQKVELDFDTSKLMCCAWYWYCLSCARIFGIYSFKNRLELYLSESILVDPALFSSNHFMANKMANITSLYTLPRELLDLITNGFDLQDLTQSAYHLQSPEWVDPPRPAILGLLQAPTGPLNRRSPRLALLPVEKPCDLLRLAQCDRFAVVYDRSKLVRMLSPKRYYPGGSYGRPIPRDKNMSDEEWDSILAKNWVMSMANDAITGDFVVDALADCLAALPFIRNIKVVRLITDKLIPSTPGSAKLLSGLHPLRQKRSACWDGRLFAAINVARIVLYSMKKTQNSVESLRLFEHGSVSLAGLHEVLPTLEKEPNSGGLVDIRSLYLNISTDLRCQIGGHRTGAWSGDEAQCLFQGDGRYHLQALFSTLARLLRLMPTLEELDLALVGIRFVNGRWQRLEIQEERWRPLLPFQETWNPLLSNVLTSVRLAKLKHVTLCGFPVTGAAMTCFLQAHPHLRVVCAKEYCGSA